MSIAGPLDEPSPARFRLPVSRRTVLGAAVAGGAGIAAVRLAVYPRIEELLGGATALTGGRSDWLSPLGSNTAKVAHLLRRTTFGASLDDLEKAASDGYQRTVDRLLETPPAAPPALAGTDDPTQDRRLNIGQLQLWWMDHMLSSPAPFAERMTLFWHGHFTSDF